MSAVRAAFLVVAGVAALLVAGSAASAVDPAETALRSRDVYIAPRALGSGTGEARRRLQEVVRRLAARRQPVKIAIVVGPTGAPSIRIYARRLRASIAFAGTLVVTARGRPVVAVGPRAPAAITRDLRAAGVAAVADPVERAIRATEVAVGPEPPDAGGSGLRGLSALLGLAVLGGAWAAAWGLRRERRHASIALSDARALMRVRLDALRARARDLGAREDLDHGTRELVAQAIGAYSEGLVDLERARTTEQVERAEPSLGRGLDALTEAGRTLGEPLDLHRPFDGLCAVDPGHGVARESALIEADESEAGVCADCARALAAGETRARRTVPVGGRPVRFDEAPIGATARSGEPGEDHGP